MRIIQVDAFIDGPSSGNPAGVCVLTTHREDDWMQAVATEMNLSETAFLRSRADGVYDLRWFTPTEEVDLCGHPTLASAHVLWTEGIVDITSRIDFDTKSGRLSTSFQDGWVQMDFPLEAPTPVEAPADLESALGMKPVEVMQNRLDLFVLLDNEAAVRSLAPDLLALAQLDARGIVVTTLADRDTPADFVSRFFGPRVGVPEDPVTGSAHCGLAPLWAEKTGRQELVGYQASRRGGIVRVQLHKADRVFLSGRAVTAGYPTLSAI